MVEQAGSTVRQESPPEGMGSGPLGSDEVLAHWEVCRSGPLDLIRENLTSYFYPARVETLDSSADLSSSLLSAVRLNHVTLGFLRFGSAAMVDPGALGAYHINVPLSGRVASECGDRQTVAVVGRGAVFTPRDHTVLPWWSDDASQVCIKISKSAVETELEGLLGHPIATDIRFGLPLDLSTAAAVSWLRVIRLLIDEADQPDGLLRSSPAHREYLEKLVISGLLHVQVHNYLDVLLSPQPAARPRVVKRVTDLVEAHPEVNYTLSDLARHAGVGARRLQTAFHEHLRTSPTGYLRKVKLERARADLLAHRDTVTAIAYRWGFNHPGRFSRIYSRTYGELPSQTAQRGPQ